MNEKQQEGTRSQYVAFLAPPEMVDAIDDKAQASERTRSQQLRYMLTNSLNQAGAPQRHPYSEAAHANIR